MALEYKYKVAFQKECNQLSQMVIGSLQKLATNPTDVTELRKMVQAADTIMGNARFLKDVELERHAAQIVKSFGSITDIRTKIDQYGVVLEQFGRLTAKTGACPKGYEVVNGTCVRIE